MALYSIDVTLHATAYIKADSEEAARAIAAKLNDTGFTVDDDTTVIDGPEISGLRYDDPDLPDVSLSPSMTLRVSVEAPFWSVTI